MTDDPEDSINTSVRAFMPLPNSFLTNVGQRSTEVASQAVTAKQTPSEITKDDMKETAQLQAKVRTFITLQKTPH